MPEEKAPVGLNVQEIIWWDAWQHMKANEAIEPSSALACLRKIAVLCSQIQKIRTPAGNLIKGIALASMDANQPSAEEFGFMKSDAEELRSALAEAKR